jgi:hypothetical protein
VFCDFLLVHHVLPAGQVSWESSENSNLMPPFVDVGFSIVCLQAITPSLFQ